MNTQNNTKWEASLSPAGAFALSLGTSIGWGSLVITSNTYLLEAGPLGTILGLFLGALLMLLISRNYHYMINCCPEAGGAYAYARDAFGYDHGFVTAWFLVLTYLAMLWANLTSLPLFASYFFGDLFQTGFLYKGFSGYPVYLGEILLCFFALALVTFLCVRRKRLTRGLLLGMVLFFIAGISLCFFLTAARQAPSLDPAFVPGSPAPLQVLRIACISPWAFIGFESMSHGAEEFSFPHKKSFRILAVSVVITALLYILITLLSVAVQPSGYGDWLSYLQAHENLDGLERFPAFYAARSSLGTFGLALLLLSLLALILTSLIGNLMALSRLLFALARDHLLPSAFFRLNREGTPENALLLAALISLPVPLLGRTAIGWIVDVTTLGATIIYGFVSASVLKTASFRNDKREVWTGFWGLLCMIGIGMYLLLPNLFTNGTLASESYFLFVIWSVLGFLFFRIILARDKTKRFGNSIIVWIVLLSLMLFTSLVWMNQSIMQATSRALTEVQEYYRDAGFAGNADLLIQEELIQVRASGARSILMVIGIFGISLGVLLNNYSLISRRARESEAELGQVRSKAYTDPLTGVKSKHAYAEREMALDAAIRGGTAGEFALVICDVNGLKYINDTFGHKAGDDYIRSASHMICELFQHSPVYRTGGDEFVVYLSGGDLEQKEKILAELNRRSEAHISSGEVVVSAGCADFLPDKDTSLRQVFERADALMYQRKQFLKHMGAHTRL